VAIRTRAQLEELVASVPVEWTNDSEQKTDVAFLLDRPEAQVFHAFRSELKHGQGIVELDDPYTARNVNTVRKLLDLVRGLG
jgi:uncharacterized protein (DUF1697 family)